MQALLNFRLRTAQLKDILIMSNGFLNLSAADQPDRHNQHGAQISTLVSNISVQLWRKQSARILRISVSFIMSVHNLSVVCAKFDMSQYKFIVCWHNLQC